MIFISYRISDANDTVTHLDECLVQEFGGDAVFRDRSRLKAGVNWSAEIEGQANACKVMLVVIGPEWESASFHEGTFRGFPRLHDPQDWVRREISTGLKSRKHVIPVLLDGASLPAKKWLENFSLGELSERQGVRLRPDDFYKTDLPELVKQIRILWPDAPKAKRGGDRGSPRPQAEDSWYPHAATPLQPAAHFSGRQKELQTLTAWAAAPATPTRVTALIAPGGTGKTALAHKTLQSVGGENPFGVFGWSFYTHPQTELFLREAIRYFSRGEPPASHGELLLALQRALSGGTPHLLILDGLELMQSERPPKGHLQNEPQLKILLRWLADGFGTRAKALITSRYALPDLADHLESSYREVKLDDLEVASARALLLRRGVVGDDPTLDALAARFHNHALTLDALGLYLARFHKGDPARAPTFSPKELGEFEDPRASRLAKVLTQYAKKLPPDERDLLARISLFPRGISLEYLGVLVGKAGKVAGALNNYSNKKLLSLLDGLESQGLVFRVGSAEGGTFSAHPFLRDFFGGLLGASTPAQVHELLRLKLAPSLEGRPRNKPSDPQKLDRYEQLIELTRLAGKTQQAFDLYWYGLDGYDHLGCILGDNVRGQRICSSFAADGTPSNAAPDLPKDERGLLVSEWGLFAKDLGDFAVARDAFTTHIRFRETTRDGKNLSIGYLNLCELELLAGRGPAAREAAEAALGHAAASRHDEARGDSHSYLAAALSMLGQPSKARNSFASAAKIQHAIEWDDGPLYSVSGIWQAELNLATGDVRAAREQTRANLEICVEYGLTRDQALCHTLLGHCSDSAAEARVHLDFARKYASRSGDIFVGLRCHRLAAALSRAEKEHAASASEAVTGIQLADSCGFGCLSADLRIELAETHLSKGEFGLAVSRAEQALEISEREDVQYAWGIADACHVLGVAQGGVKNCKDARRHLARAVQKRTSLEHRDIQLSRDALVALPA